MLFEIYVTRSYVVSEEAKATVEAASAEEAVEAAQSDMESLTWETIDEEPCQDMKTACKQVQDVRPDFRVAGGRSWRGVDLPLGLEAT
jgi:hypothetical protein